VGFMGRSVQCPENFQQNCSSIIDFCVVGVVLVMIQLITLININTWAQGIAFMFIAYVTCTLLTIAIFSGISFAETRQWTRAGLCRLLRKQTFPHFPEGLFDASDWSVRNPLNVGIGLTLGILLWAIVRKCGVSGECVSLIPLKNFDQSSAHSRRIICNVDQQ
jgi:hypothetical protein